MLQKQYSSAAPEARKCRLSTMWLWPPTKGSIDPGRLQDRRARRFLPGTSHPVRRERRRSRSREAHRKRASGDVVGTQLPDELHVEVADRLVRVRVARSSADGVDLRRRVRAITQVHRGQAEVGPMNHGLIEPLQQDDERIGGRSLSLRPHPPREQQRGRSNERRADRSSTVDHSLAVHLLPPSPDSPPRLEQGHCCSEERGLGVAKATHGGWLPQEGVWARLDPLNGRRYALVPDVSIAATLLGNRRSPAPASRRPRK